MIVAFVNTQRYIKAASVICWNHSISDRRTSCAGSGGMVLSKECGSRACNRALNRAARIAAVAVAVNVEGDGGGGAIYVKARESGRNFSESPKYKVVG